MVCSFVHIARSIPIGAVGCIQCRNDNKNLGIHKSQNGAETLMQRAWVTHHHCPLALEQSVMGGAGINVNPKKIKDEK